MTGKTTGELLDNLTDPSARLPHVLERLERDFLEKTDLASYLGSLLRDGDLRKSQVIRISGLNETFAYQIFNGSRQPSRNRLLQLLFSLRCDLDQADQALYRAGSSCLNCHNRRDAIIIFCLTHEYTLQETDEELLNLGELMISESHENHGNG